MVQSLFDNFERFAAHQVVSSQAPRYALESLGMKGYRLVGCDSTGTNAFFLRDDLAQENTYRLSQKANPHLNWLERGISERQQLEIIILPIHRSMIIFYIRYPK